MAMNVDAVLRLGAKVDGLNSIVAFNRGLQSVETTAKGVSGAMRGMTGAAAGLSGALGTLAPLLSVAGLVGMVQNTIKAGDAMYDLSQRTGVSVEALARFKKAAATSGTDIDNVAKSLNMLNKGLFEVATTGKGKAAEGLKILGLSAFDARGKLKSADQVTLEVANKFKNLANDGIKAGVAMKLFGRNGTEMIPMLNMGGDAISSLSVKMTEAFAKKADEYSDKLAILSGKVGALGADLTIALLPALQSVTDAVTAGVTAFNALPDPVKNLAVSGAALAIAWGPITGILSSVAGGIKLFGSAISGVIGYVTAAGLSLEGLAVMATDAGFALAAVPVAGWVAAAVAGLAALSVALYQNSEGFRNWANTSLNFIKVLAADGMNTMKSFGQWLGSMWSGLVGAARQVGRGIAAAFSGPFGVIAAVAKSVFDFVGQKIQGLYNMLPTAVKKAIGGVGSYIQGAWNKAAGMSSGGSGSSGSGGGGINPELNLDQGGSKGSKGGASRDAQERAKLELDGAAALLAQDYIKDQRQINDLKRVGNQLQSSGNALKALEVEKSQAILEAQLDEKKLNDDTVRKLQESSKNQDQTNRKLRDKVIIQEAAVKLGEIEERRRGTLLDIDLKITQERKRQAKEQADALKEIGNRSRYQMIGDLQGSEAAQRQREIDDYKTRIGAARKNGNEEEARRLEERLRRLQEEYKKLDELANNAAYGIAKGIRGYIESIGSLADSMSSLTKNVFQGLEDKLVEFVTTGKVSFQEFANEIIKQLTRIAIQQAIMKPLLQGIGSLFGGGLGGASMFTPNFSAMEFAANGLVAANGIRPFAMGGVVDQPTLFKFASGGAGNLGLMGEAGPEAIMPLKRGKDGKLGVAGSGDNIGITVNVDAKGTSVQGESDKGAALGRVVSQAVQAELIKQRRPGGLLAA